MVTICDEKIFLKEMLVSEKELSDINFEKLKKCWCTLKIDTDNMYLTVDSLIDINNIISNSNNITLRKVNFKKYECDKINMNKGLIEDEMYQLIDQFNERKVNQRGFYSVLLEMEIGNLQYITC